MEMAWRTAPGSLVEKGKYAGELNKEEGEGREYEEI
jgi:hypothetical protein